jgi:hypothetical protein
MRIKMSFSVRQVTRDALWITPRMSLRDLLKLGALPYLIFALLNLAGVLGEFSTNGLEGLTREYGLKEYGFLSQYLGKPTYLILPCVLYGLFFLTFMVKWNRYVLLGEKDIYEPRCRVCALEG